MVVDVGGIFHASGYPFFHDIFPCVGIVCEFICVDDDGTKHTLERNKRMKRSDESLFDSNSNLSFGKSTNIYIEREIYARVCYIFCIKTTQNDAINIPIK